VNDSVQSRCYERLPALCALFVHKMKNIQVQKSITKLSMSVDPTNERWVIVLSNIAKLNIDRTKTHIAPKVSFAIISIFIATKLP
jgi:hypothetical protein